MFNSGLSRRASNMTGAAGLEIRKRQDQTLRLVDPRPSALANLASPYRAADACRVSA